MRRILVFILSSTTLFSAITFAQSKPTDHKRPVTGLFLGAQAIYGDINYKTTSPINGFVASDVTQPNYGFRLITGWNFNEHWGSELGMVYFGHITFKGLGAPPKSFSIYHNLMYLTAKYRQPLGQRFAVDVRGGFGYISRKGITIGGVKALDADEFFVPVYGANVSYNITPRWTAQATWLGAPGRSKYQLPSSNMFGLGFIYRFGQFNELIG